MKNQNNLFSGLWFGPIFFICLLLTLSCAYRPSYTQTGFDGHLSIILELVSKGGQDISIIIGELTLKREGVEQAVTIPINEKFMLNKSPKKVLLGDFSIKPDLYTGLVFSLQEAFLFTEGKLTPLSVKTENITYDTDIEIGPWERKSLLLKIICGLERDKKKDAFILTSFIKPGIRSVGLRGLKAYVTDEAGDCVVIFDQLSRSIIETVPVGDKPRGIVMSPDRAKVYIVNSGSDSISVLDTLTSEVTDTIFLGLGVNPGDIAITHDGRLLLTANKGSGNISLIDPDSQRVIEHIPVGQSPSQVAVGPWGDWAYVTNQRSNNLMIIDLNERRVSATIATRPEPVGITSSPGGDEIYISSKGSDVIQVIDRELGKIINILPTNSGPVDIILDDTRRRLYVANSQSNDVCFLIEDMNMKEAVIPVGMIPTTMALDKSGRLLYVVNQGDGTVSVIDLGKERVIDVIKVGKKPWGIVIDKIWKD